MEAQITVLMAMTSSFTGHDAREKLGGDRFSRFA